MKFGHRWTRDTRDRFWAVIVATSLAVRSHARDCWAAIGITKMLAIGSDTGNGRSTIIVGTSRPWTAQRSEAGPIAKRKRPSCGCPL